MMSNFYDTSSSQGKLSTLPKQNALHDGSANDVPGFSSRSSTMMEPASPDHWVQFDCAPKPTDATTTTGLKMVQIPSPFFLSSEDSSHIIASPIIKERNQWISFHAKGVSQKNAPSSEEAGLESSSNDKKVFDASYVNQTAQCEKRLLPAGKGKTSSVVEEQSLVKYDSSSDSDLSDEIVDLDYESDEAKKLRNTPVKKYPDLKLFMAKSVQSPPAQHTIAERPVFDRKSPDLCQSVANVDLDLYPDVDLACHWKFFCRYPHNKKILGSRKWVPVDLAVTDNFIKISGSVNGNDISREIPLHPFFVFTVPKVHEKENGCRVIAIKLQYVKYSETRHLLRGLQFEHTPTYSPILKIGSSNFLDIKEFVRQAESVIRKIPLTRERGIAYRHQELFIDCDDDCQFLLSGTGEILKHNISVHMRVRAFITGQPELRMFLNDIRFKEKSAMHFNSKNREAPQNVWMEPKECEYHPCVDRRSSELEGSLLFTPPDGCSFELLRIRVLNRKPLPVLAKCSIHVLTANSVKIMASVQAIGDAKSLRRRRNNVVFYIPLSERCEDFFFKSKGFSGQKHFLSAKTKDGLKPSVARKGNVSIEISAGQAEYETAYGSLVWRLGGLPLSCSRIPADAEHKFSCKIDIPSGASLIDFVHPYGYVAFDISHSVGSDIHVQELLLSNAQVPEKWVSYQASFFYKIHMKVFKSGVES